MQKVQTMVPLNERILRDGFALVPNVFSHEETATLIDGLKECGLPRSRAGLRHAMRMRVASVAALAQDPRLLGVAQQVFGNSALPFRATLFDKSPTANWLVVWHQDTALPLRERREIAGWGPWSVKDGVIYAHAPAAALLRVLALRVHLDDSTAENGPLRVLPGTHTLGVLTDDIIHEHSNRVAAGICIVPRGGVLAMSPLIIHASSKSLVDQPRRVLHIEYASPPVSLDGLELAVA